MDDVLPRMNLNNKLNTYVSIVIRKSRVRFSYFLSHVRLLMMTLVHKGNC